MHITFPVRSTAAGIGPDIKNDLCHIVVLDGPPCPPDNLALQIRSNGPLAPGGPDHNAYSIAMLDFESATLLHYALGVWLSSRPYAKRSVPEEEDPECEKAIAARRD